MLPFLFVIIDRFKTRTLFVFILAFAIGIIPEISSQNFIPNGGFELLKNDQCAVPDESFDRSQFWYALDATPDLFVKNCPFDENAFTFWEASVDAVEGNNFAGLWSRWNSNETYFTEGIATSLAEPLEAGKTYLLEMFIKNQGGFQGLEDDISGCSLKPTKHLDLYLSSDSIFVTNDFSNGTASTSIPIAATFDSEEITGGKGDEWKKISTCFTAIGDESFLGLILPLGTFGELPPCAMMSNSGVFRSFYYFIDDISIVELPDKIESEITTCSDREYEVDLLELFDIPLLSSAVFEWEDGSSQSPRVLSQTGNFQIDAILSCGILPLTLIVIPENCESSFYVPNVFSPNADGQNDNFKVSFGNGIEAFNYQLSIIDRWGNVVFESRDPDQDWDGSFNGQLAQSGIYAWALKFDSEISEESQSLEEMGSVFLMR